MANLTLNCLATFKNAARVVAEEKATLKRGSTREGLEAGDATPFEKISVIERDDDDDDDDDDDEDDAAADEEEAWESLVSGTECVGESRPRLSPMRSLTESGTRAAWRRRKASSESSSVNH